MRRLLPLVTSLVILAVPGAAAAAPVKIAPRASAVSDAGRATVEVANPNRYALRGTAKVAAAGRTVAARKVRLPKLAVSTVKLSFGEPAMAALRDAAGRATMKLQLRRRGGRKTSARRTLTLRLPAGVPQPPQGGGGAAPSDPTSDRWVGRMGDEGAYDDLELTVSGGQLQITKAPLVPVYCFESASPFRKAVSYEPFAVAGPWTIGTDAIVEQQGLSVNSIVSGGARPINYKVTGSAQQPGLVTGTLGMSYFDSKYDIFTNSISFVNCSGAQSFEAVPA